MPKQYRISLDLYPNDILHKIVSIAGVNNLLQVLPCPSFLKLNQNFKAAINTVIAESGYTYHNNTTGLGFLMEEEDILDESDFNSSREFEIFDDYCKAECVRAVCNIHYELRNVEDFIGFERFFSILHLTNSLDLKVHLNLRTCGLRFVDLNGIVSAIKLLEDRITGFVIANPDNINIIGDFDWNFFQNAEVLQICGISVCGSISKCCYLRELIYVSPREPGCPLDVGNLPLTLKRFTCDVDSLSLYSTLPDAGEYPCLEELSFIGFPSALPAIVKDILWKMTCPATESIKYMDDGSGNLDDLVMLIDEVAREVGFTLKSLTLGGKINDQLRTCPTEVLDLRKSDNELISWLKLSPTMERLILVQQESLKVGELVNIVPSGLEYLELSGDEDDFDDLNTDLSKLKKLKYLALHLCNINFNDIDNFQFPQSLQVLDLSGVDWTGEKGDFSKLFNLKSLILSNLDIESLAGLTFPDSLQYLDISRNNIKYLHNASFPKSLRHLNLFGNAIKSGKHVEEILGSLHLETLHLGNKMEFSNFNLPLKLLSLNRCKLSGVCRFDNLDSLQMELCEILEGTKLIFTHLRRLSIVHCLTDNIEVEFSPNLETVELSYNDLVKIPSALSQLEKLRVLKLNHNQIKDAAMTFCTNSLEVLNLSSNRIEEVNLVFPKGATNLKQLDLCGNQLKEVSIGSIGHNSESLLNNLYELSLSDNLLEANQIAVLASELPGSVRTLWGDKRTSSGPGNWLYGDIFL